MSSTTTARKELTRALRATFTDISEQQTAQLSSTGHAGGSTQSGGDAAAGAATAGESGMLFEDYAPPEELLNAIETYAGSSEIQALGGQDRDIVKLQEVLLEDCYNEGILAIPAKDEALRTRVRSAFILVLAKFASLDSQIVSPAEIRYVWWMRLLKPAFVPQDAESYNYGSRQLQEKASLDHIRLGRQAARAAKDMVINALCSAPDDKDNAKWRNEIFSLYFQSELGSFAEKSFQEILIGFCKAHPVVSKGRMTSRTKAESCFRPSTRTYMNRWTRPRSVHYNSCWHPSAWRRFKRIKRSIRLFCGLSWNGSIVSRPHRTVCATLDQQTLSKSPLL